MPRRLAAFSFAAIAFFLAACGGTGPATSPGGPARSLAPLPSLAVPSNGMPSLGIPSIGAPSIGASSFAPDADLEALFPDTVNGQSLQITSAKGEDVVQAFGGDEPEEFRNFVSGLGATMEQVSAAISFNIFPAASSNDFTGFTLVAVRVQGVPGPTTLAGITELTKQDVANAQVGTATIGGKQVTAITNPENADENVYLYAIGDVVFFGGGTPSHVEEAFAQLP